MGSLISTRTTLGEVDLLPAAKFELDFLRAVDRLKPALYEEQSLVLRNAIRRYESLWLPLIIARTNYIEASKEKYTFPLDVAPIDIRWIWHCHMMSPAAYSHDVRLLGAVDLPLHNFYDRDEEAMRMRRVRRIWEKAYPDEPFLPSTDEGFVRGMLKGSSTDSHSTRGLFEAVSKQRIFYYQASLYQYRDAALLREAIDRYKQFLRLKRLNPDRRLVPVGDVDLVRRAHRAFPRDFEKVTKAAIGRVWDDDDVEIDDDNSDVDEDDDDDATERLWRENFGTEFFKSGFGWRGIPPDVWMSKKLLPPFALNSVVLHRRPFSSVPASRLQWAWQGLPTPPDAKSLVEMAVHGVENRAALGKSASVAPQLSVLVMRGTDPAASFSAAFLISDWTPPDDLTFDEMAPLSTPRIYAACHTVSTETLREESVVGCVERATMPTAPLPEDETSGAVLVKNAQGDFSVLLARWEGDATSGHLRVTRFNLRHKELLSLDEYAICRPRISVSFEVSAGAPGFRVGPVDADSAAGLLHFDASYGVDERAAGLVEAFGVAALAASLREKAPEEEAMEAAKAETASAASVEAALSASLDAAAGSAAPAASAAKEIISGKSWRKVELMLMAGMKESRFDLEGSESHPGSASEESELQPATEEDLHVDDTAMVDIMLH